MSIYLGKQKVSTKGGTISLGGVDTSDATASREDILYGETAYANNIKLVGSMTNNGSVYGTLKNKFDSYAIPSGYHNGNGIVQIDINEQNKITPENIKKGITILGVTGINEGGSSGGTTDMKPQSKTIIPSDIDQTIYPDSGYNCFSYVVVKKIPYSEIQNSSGGTTVTIG